MHKSDVDINHELNRLLRFALVCDLLGTRRMGASRLGRVAARYPDGYRGRT